MRKTRSRHGNGLTRREFVGAAGVSVAAVTAGLGTRRVGAGNAAQTAQRGFMRARRSPWFEPVEGKDLRCTLCPRLCRIAPGRRGDCRVRENRDGAGYTLVYGAPAIVQMDPIERKPFFHVLPGSRSLSVATAGCNMACKFCQVWDMALVEPEDVHAYDVPPEDAVRHAREAGARSVAFTYGEPVAYFEYMLDTARLARQAGLRALLHSNGYIRPAPLEQLCETLDGANIDLKGFDEAFYRDVCGGERDPVLDTLRTLRTRGVHLEITSILIPTLNDRPEDIRRMCRWIREELGAETPLHFSRFYPLYRLSHLPPTPVSTLEEAHAIAADERLNYVYIANVPGHDAEKTVCPGCGRLLIDRLGFVVDDVQISRGQCAHCDRPIAGIWE